MLASIFRRLRALRPSNTTPIPPLGRWCIKDKSKNNWKIDMANVDHCGTCAAEPANPVSTNKDMKTPSQQMKEPVTSVPFK